MEARQVTYKEVKIMIAGLGLPYAYNEFAKKTEQSPPFICFLFTDRSNDLMADNKNYCKVRPLAIELYTDYKDFAKEEAIETALANAGLAFQRSEAYIESEHMYQITYNTEVLING